MIRPEDLLRPELCSLAAYRVADAAGLIKLDAMENPHPFPADLVDAWLAELRKVELNRYPSADASELKQRLRQVMAVPDCADILLGNGSDEILQMLMQGLARPGACLLTPEPGFAMFRLISQTTGLGYQGVELDEHFQLDLAATLAAIESHKPALILVAQPNNPTGNAFAEADLRRIIEAAPGLVVIDEAYYPFARQHCLGWLAEYDNLLVMRTLSKLGLASLRLGWLMGPPNWIKALEPLRLPYNINGLTQASASFALAHYAQFLQQAERITTQREALLASLSALPGLRIYPSQANFLLLRLATVPADQAHQQLRERGILVKNLSAAHARLENCLRLTVGTEQENAAVITAMTEILGA